VCSWFVRITRFGTTHLVRAQEAENSCGINSVMMAVCRMNKLTLLADGNYAEQLVYPKYDASYDGTSYTYTDKLADLLNKLKMGTWESVDVGATGVADAVVKSASFFQLSSVPIIVHVRWDDGGGHFVLIDYTFNVLGNHYATVCDPWDGHVHVTKMKSGSAVRYEADTKSVIGWSIDKPTHSYDKVNKGKFSGWLVRCTGMDVKARLGKVFLGTGM
jgi:hypothetical protein